MAILAHLIIEAQNGPLSEECVDRGIISFLSFIEWVEQLPYKRNSDRSDYSLVLEEECGACSTKNALVNAVAIENGWTQVQLFLGVYKLSEETNPGVGKVLANHGLTEIPECHTYLKIDDVVRDATGLPKGEKDFLEVLQMEIEIKPDQIADFKENWHQDYLKGWATDNNLTLEEAWGIRQECIAALN